MRPVAETSFTTSISFIITENVNCLSSSENIAKLRNMLSVSDAEKLCIHDL